MADFGVRSEMLIGNQLNLLSEFMSLTVPPMWSFQLPYRFSSLNMVGRIWRSNPVLGPIRICLALASTG